MAKDSGAARRCIVSLLCKARNGVETCADQTIVKDTVRRRHEVRVKKSWVRTTTSTSTFSMAVCATARTGLCRTVGHDFMSSVSRCVSICKLFHCYNSSVMLSLPSPQLCLIIQRVVWSCQLFVPLCTVQTARRWYGVPRCSSG